MTDNLLKEAIADAKQVKAAAIANAKAAIEEAFKPHLSQMLSTKLRTEMEDSTKGDGHGTEDGGETDKQAVVEKINPASSDVGPSDNKQPSSDTRTSSNVPNPGQEVDGFGEGESGADPKIGGSDPAPHGSDAHPEKLHEDEMPFDDEEEDGEVDLDALPGEEGGEGDLDMTMGLGGDEMGGMNGMGDMGDMGDMDNGDGDEDEDDLGALEAIIRELEAEVMNSAPDPMADPLTADTAMATEDVSATASKDSIEQTKDIEPHLAPEGESETLKLSENESDTVNEEDLEEILREMEAEDATDPNFFARVEALQTENADLKRSLKEHHNVVKYLKDRINEINVLNAKLLFTNKLFKTYNLNAGQKMRVVETFDRANNIREVKIIYTTLAEAYAGKTTSGTKKAKSITEGLASRPVGSTKPKSQQVLTETDAIKARFKKLAGIV